MTTNQINFAALQETKRSNRSREQETNRSNIAREAEEARANRATETETRRSNLAREFETNRANKASEDLRRRDVTESERSNRAKQAEDRRHNLATEANQIYQTDTARYSARHTAALNDTQAALNQADLVTRDEVNKSKAYANWVNADAARTRADAAATDARTHQYQTVVQGFDTASDQLVKLKKILGGTWK